MISRMKSRTGWIARLGWLLLCGLGSATPVAAQESATPLARLFQQPTGERDGSGRGDKLARVLAEHARLKPPQWLDDLESIRKLSPLERMQAVQERINQRIVFRDDPENRWQSPAESYRGGGDCEDFALAKLLLLQESGFPEHRLRLVTLAPSSPDGVHHVILLAWVQEKIYVLDSPKRTPDSRVVTLERYRDAGRPVVWAGWRGGVVAGLGSGAVQGFAEATGMPKGATRLISYRHFPLKEKLVRIAADWLVIHPWEPPLTPSEVERLRLLRLYYHDPSPENGRAITRYEAERLDALRRIRQAL